MLRVIGVKTATLSVRQSVFLCAGEASLTAIRKQDQGLIGSG